MFFLSHQLQDGPDLTFFFRHSILPPSIQRREKVKYLQIFFSENYLRMLMPDMTAFCRSGQWTHYRRSFPAAKATNGPQNGGLSFGFLFYGVAAKARGELLRHRHRYRQRAGAVQKSGLTILAKFRRNFGKFSVSASYREKKFRYFSPFSVFKFKNSKKFVKNWKKI